MLTIAESLRQEGFREGELQIAKRMLARQLPLEDIMEFTDLTMDQIQALAADKDRPSAHKPVAQ